MNNRQYGTITEESPEKLRQTMQEADAMGFEVHGGPIVIEVTESVTVNPGPNQFTRDETKKVMMLLISKPVARIALPRG